MCKRLANDTIVVSRYINPDGHAYPEPAEADAGGSFTTIQRRFSEGVVICQFSLSNFTSDASKPSKKPVPPLSQSMAYYPMFAAGLLNDDGKCLSYSMRIND